MRIDLAAIAGRACPPLPAVVTQNMIYGRDLVWRATRAIFIDDRVKRQLTGLRCFNNHKNGKK